jgi:hypothetical protein
MIASTLFLTWSLGACVYQVDTAIPDSLARFEPGLVGTWVSERDTAVITSSDDLAYRIAFHGGDGDSMQFDGRSGSLGDRTVLEILPAFGDDNDWPVGRMLLVVDVAGAEVRLRVLEADSLRAPGAGRAPAIPYVARGNDVILTAATAQLVPALREHVRRPGVLTGEQIWRRVSIPPT